MRGTTVDGAAASGDHILTPMRPRREPRPWHVTACPPAAAPARAPRASCARTGPASRSRRSSRTSPAAKTRRKWPRRPR
ncbi:hypothetical protein D8M29_09025, partial [Micrococcus sp. HSID17227]